jgi:hypothetical protein
MLMMDLLLQTTEVIVINCFVASSQITIRIWYIQVVRTIACINGESILSNLKLRQKSVNNHLHCPLLLVILSKIMIYFQ